MSSVCSTVINRVLSFLLNTTEALLGPILLKEHTHNGIIKAMHTQHASQLLLSVSRSLQRTVRHASVCNTWVRREPRGAEKGLSITELAIIDQKHRVNNDPAAVMNSLPVSPLWSRQREKEGKKNTNKIRKWIGVCLESINTANIELFNTQTCVIFNPTQSGEGTNFLPVVLRDQ